jgi:hypothetical protein
LKYAELFEFMDEFEELPGLAEYVQRHAVNK